MFEVHKRYKHSNPNSNLDIIPVTIKPNDNEIEMTVVFCHTRKKEIEVFTPGNQIYHNVRVLREDVKYWKEVPLDTK